MYSYQQPDEYSETTNKDEKISEDNKLAKKLF